MHLEENQFAGNPGKTTCLMWILERKEIAEGKVRGRESGGNTERDDRGMSN